MRNFLTKVVEKIKTHFIICNMFQNILPFMRKCGKIFYSRTDHRRQYGACVFHVGYVRLQTDTHTQRTRNTHCFSTATMVARLTVTLYVHCLSCSNFYNSDHLDSTSVLLISFRYNVPDLTEHFKNTRMSCNCNAPSHCVCGAGYRLLQPFSAALLCEPNLHVR